MESDPNDYSDLQSAKRILQDRINCPAELPDEFMLSAKPGYHRHKYRTNWFQGAMSAIETVAEILADNQLHQDVQDLKRRKKEKHEHARTTREEIDECDQLITRALQKLQDII